MAFIDLRAVDGPTCIGGGAVAEASEIGGVEGAEVTAEDYAQWVLATLGGRAVSSIKVVETPIHLQIRDGGHHPIPSWNIDTAVV